MIGSNNDNTPSGVSLVNDAVILFADLQDGISTLPLTVDHNRLQSSVRALARLAKIFHIPVIVSTVPGRDGVPAKVMPALEEIFGDFMRYERTTAAAFANEPIAKAMADSGRSTVLVSGVATEVAVQLACLSAVARGYKAQVVVDACAGISARTEDAAFRRLTAAGVTLTSVPTLAGELAGDFSLPDGQAAIGVLFEMARG